MVSISAKTFKIKEVLDLGPSNCMYELMPQEGPERRYRLGVYCMNHGIYLVGQRHRPDGVSLRLPLKMVCALVQCLRSAGAPLRLEE